jgi:hypothetical protein
MLVAGMDVSGDYQFGNHKFMGIVIGTSESIMALSKDIGHLRTHVSGLKPAEQEAITKKMTFDYNNRIAICFRLNQNEIIDRVKQRRQIRQRRTPEGKLVRLFHRVAYQFLKPEIERFVLSHNQSVNELIVECDRDCSSFVKENSLKADMVKDAHKIADIIAWSNNKSKNIPSIIEIDVTKEIEEMMVERLR